MNKKLSIAKAALSLIATLGFCAGAAQAQSEFPAKPVNLIVPFPPGGAVDQAGRSIAQSLSKVWKQPVIIVTRPGAGGGVGMAAAANSPPDGYTLLATHPAILAVPEADRMFGRTPTSERSDFAPLALLVADPLVLVVKAGRHEHTAKRISRITASDVHLILQKSGSEITVSLAEIEEVELRRVE